MIEPRDIEDGEAAPTRWDILAGLLAENVRGGTRWDAYGGTTSGVGHGGAHHGGMPDNMNATSLSAHDVRRVSVLAAVDQRTVVRYLTGGRQPCTTRARIAGALRELGLAAPAPASSTTREPLTR